jgi:hypothetical protein
LAAVAGFCQQQLFGSSNVTTNPGATTYHQMAPGNAPMQQGFSAQESGDTFMADPHL